MSERLMAPVGMLPATIQYLRKDPKYATEKPYRLVEIDPTPEIPPTNLGFESRPIQVQDIRETKEPLAIDVNGFQLCTWPGKISFDTGYDELEEYCREMADRVKKELGALKVFVIEFRFRSNKTSFIPTPVQASREMKEQGAPAVTFSGKPALFAHVDQSRDGGLRRVRRNFTVEEASRYLSDGYRVRIINVWRSFNSTAQDLPLAFCKPESVAVEDTVLVDYVSPDKVGESSFLYYNPNHKWLWASNMSPAEVFVFTTWDSTSSSDTIKCAYHCAFPNPQEGIPVAPRESLEIRLIVVNDT